MLSAINDICLKCEQAECPGICDKVKDDMGEVNYSTSTHTITWHGVTRTVNEWAEILGLTRQALYKRLEAAESEEEALSTALTGKEPKANISRAVIEETFVRLSTMHLDYMLYWNRMTPNDSSAGMVARYGAVRASPTNATSNPVERRALPELNMSDEALYRRAWVACVMYIIEKYRARNATKPFPGDKMRATILEWRAIDGLTIKKMCDKLDEMEICDRYYTSPMRVRRFMDYIVHDVAEEALKRGLIRGTQK